MNTEDYLKDLYELGIVQGEHNINWTDEYNLLEYCMDYYTKTKKIADKYNIQQEKCFKKDPYLLDKLAFDLNERVREHILKSIS